MVLADKVKTSILHEIERWSNILTENKDLKPVSQGKQTWQFENPADWHYGHFIGMIEGLAVLYHHVTHRRQITAEELKEIEEFIEKNTRQFRDYFFKN